MKPETKLPHVTASVTFSWSFPLGDLVEHEILSDPPTTDEILNYVRDDIPELLRGAIEEYDPEEAEIEIKDPDITFEVGDMVTYKPGAGVLCCGSGTYDRAMVVSTDPFVLVSPSGDMLWSATVDPADFEHVGLATRRTLIAGLDRLARERQQWKETVLRNSDENRPRRFIVLTSRRKEGVDPGEELLDEWHLVDDFDAGQAEFRKSLELDDLHCSALCEIVDGTDWPGEFTPLTPDTNER